MSLTDTPGKLRSLVLLIVAEVAAMSLWFVSSAVLGDMVAESSLGSGFQAALSSAVQGGFVIGALIMAIAGVADRYEPRIVFAFFALVAAFANGLLVVIPIEHWSSILLRGITGAALAGVYPVGMKIAVGWGQKDRGLLVGLLVGGLTLGSAAPHLLSFLGGTNWRLTVVIASLMAAASALVVLRTQNGPFHVKAAAFNPTAILQAWTNKNIRRAYGGYLGHMWELYAMWSWVGIALAISFAHTMEQSDAAEFAKLVTFIAIAAGAISCVVAGWIADRIGKAELTIIAMACSGICALLFWWSFGGTAWITVLITLIWGITIIPDSAQFSALVADYSEANQAGALLTFQTALGFTLTIVTVQLAPVLAAKIGWAAMMGVLALGPFFGIYSMWKLRKQKTSA